jgi:hypothetical protein
VAELIDVHTDLNWQGTYVNSALLTFARKTGLKGNCADTFTVSRELGNELDKIKDSLPGIGKTYIVFVEKVKKERSKRNEIIVCGSNLSPDLIHFIDNGYADYALQKGRGMRAVLPCSISCIRHLLNSKKQHNK